MSQFGFRSACLLCFAFLLHSRPVHAQDPYTPIPPGFDFPADKATLERFRKTENVAEMRRHAWLVWAGINQPAPTGGQSGKPGIPRTLSFVRTIPTRQQPPYVDGLASNPHVNFLTRTHRKRSDNPCCRSFCSAKSHWNTSVLTSCISSRRWIGLTPDSRLEPPCQNERSPTLDAKAFH